MPGSIARRRGAVTVPVGRSPRGAPTLRGRDAELKAIGHLLTAAAAGRSGVLLLIGPPGIGKSSLLAQAHGMAERIGIRVLAGAALESQQVVPLAPLLDAILHSDSPVRGVAMPRGPEDVSDLRYWMLRRGRNGLESPEPRALWRWCPNMSLVRPAPAAFIRGPRTCQEMCRRYLSFRTGADYSLRCGCCGANFQDRLRRLSS